MEVYKLVENKLKYRIKWIEVNGVRQEKRILLNDEKSIVNFFFKEKNALCNQTTCEELSLTKKQKRNIKIETIGNVTCGVDEIIEYTYAVEPIGTEAIQIFKNGQIRVFLDGNTYDCVDTKISKELTK